ncbi:hypothetical protein LG3211_4292 [Lysobacter gummosus]|nr:hypothetical protein LG3211_4292 [Lysobacter gummosus]
MLPLPFAGEGWGEGMSAAGANAVAWIPRRPAHLQPNPTPAQTHSV